MSTTAASASEHSDERGFASVRRGKRRRWWLWACAGVLALFVGLSLLSGVLGGEPGGPASSSYATQGKGVAAWASLLGRTGRTVNRLRVPLAAAQLPPGDTVIVLEPEALLASEGARLLEFVRAGGRLVYGSGDPSTLLALLRSPPPWTASSPHRYLGYDAEGQAAAGVEEADTAGEGAWSSSDGYRAPVRNSDGMALLLERSIGKGTLALLADVSPLQNRLLASADDAQLALNLAGGAGRPAVFVESVHGYGESRGLAALPSGWRLALIGLALAGVLWVAARGRRLGAAEQLPEIPPPARSAYADAIALLLRRTKDTPGVQEALEETWPRR